MFCPTSSLVRNYRADDDDEDDEDSLLMQWQHLNRPELLLMERDGKTSVNGLSFCHPSAWWDEEENQLHRQLGRSYGAQHSYYKGIPTDIIIPKTVHPVEAPAIPLSPTEDSNTSFSSSSDAAEPLTKSRAMPATAFSQSQPGQRSRSLPTSQSKKGRSRLISTRMLPVTLIWAVIISVVVVLSQQNADLGSVRLVDSIISSQLNDQDQQNQQQPQQDQQFKPSMANIDDDIDSDSSENYTWTNASAVLSVKAYPLEGWKADTPEIDPASATVVVMSASVAATTAQADDAAETADDANSSNSDDEEARPIVASSAPVQQQQEEPPLLTERVPVRVKVSRALSRFLSATVGSLVRRKQKGTRTETTEYVVRTTNAQQHNSSRPNSFLRGPLRSVNNVLTAANTINHYGKRL